MKKRIFIGILILLLSISTVSAYSFDLYGWLTGKAVENKTTESETASTLGYNSKTINGLEITAISTSYSDDKILRSAELLINGQKYKLGIGDWIIVNGKNVKLENVGSAGAVLVSVDGVMDTIGAYLIGEPTEAIIANESMVAGVSVEEICPSFVDPSRPQLWSKLEVGKCAELSKSNVCLNYITEGDPAYAVLIVDNIYKDDIKNAQNKKIGNIGMIAYLPVNETKPWNYITLTTWPCFEQVQTGNLIPIEAKEIQPQLIPGVARESCNGCLVNEKCLPFGTRMEGKYCDIKSSDLIFQSALDGECENNYECKSNECSDGKCISTAGLLQRLLDALSKLFGK